MAATKKPWGQMLGGSFLLLLLLLPGAGALPFSRIAVDSPVVTLGANVTASCTIWRSRWPSLEDGDLPMLWKWDEKFLQGIQYSPSNGVEVSNITIGPLNQTVTTLGCYIKRKGMPQMVNLTRIQAGYLPSQPQNLACVMNITTMNLTCQWDPGRTSHLLDGSTVLKVFRSQYGCNISSKSFPDCIPSAAHNSCTIPRQNLGLYQNMIFQVTVKTALGSVASEPLCADPMDLVKLDPPKLRAIQSYPEGTDCVSVEWEAAGNRRYEEQACELRYQMEGTQEWSSVHNITSLITRTQHCGFLFSVPYQFQMRCRMYPLGYWSDWSLTKLFITHEKVPSGRLDAWWKLKPREAEKRTEVQLMWKPMKPTEANGKILGYWATLHNRSPLPLCNTSAMHCNFSLPCGGIRKINLVAYNARGPSPPTVVFLHEKQGQPVPRMQAAPQDSSSFRVSWDPTQVPTTGYIIEWRRVTSADPSGDEVTGWTKLEDTDITHALIQENIEPYQRYNISIYPLYKNGVGMPRSMEAYTKQKAPSEAPKLHAGTISKSSAEIYWEPVPVEMQNGFLTNYTIFWIGTEENMSSTVVNCLDNSFTITGLWPSRMYKVHMMASTLGGGTNGTILTLYTKTMDGSDIPFVYGIIVALLITFIALIICFQKRRMKTQFWPSVPDPANSSLGRWAPAVLQEETLPPPKACELSPVIVSAILVMETDEKKCLSCGKRESPKALEGGPMASPESYGHKAVAPFPYMNSPEPVQYGKVCGEESYRSQKERSPSFHMRSNSTQPLLGDMTPSPKPYENLWFHSGQPGGEHHCPFKEEAVFLNEGLMDFPLLQGLKIEGDEDLSHLRRL